MVVTCTSPDSNNSQWTSILTPTCGQVWLKASMEDQPISQTTFTPSSRLMLWRAMMVNSPLLLFQLSPKPMTWVLWKKKCLILLICKLSPSLETSSMPLLTRLKPTNNSSLKLTTTGTGLLQLPMADLPTIFSVTLIGMAQSSRDLKKKLSMLTTWTNTQSRSSVVHLPSSRDSTFQLLDLFHGLVMTSCNSDNYNSSRETQLPSSTEDSSPTREKKLLSSNKPTMLVNSHS
jgi:hypothetical protein